jgi:hypothetical protein
LTITATRPLGVDVWKLSGSPPIRAGGTDQRSMTVAVVARTEIPT